MSTSSGIELSAGLELALGRVAGAVERAEQWRVRCAGAIQQSPPLSGLIGSTGLMDQPDLFRANTGFIWSVRRMTCNGFTSGTVTAYKNSASGEPVAPYPAPAVFTYGRGELVLQPGERLVFQGTSLAGTPQVWVTADVMESWYFPYYIQ